MGRILEIPTNAYRHHPVDELGLVIDGKGYYRQFYRAALAAQRTIVLAGWQFDSEVPLLRGEDAEGVNTPLTLLPFLNHLCEANPQLKIWILAWDFHMVFAAEREWMQKIVFNWRSNERLNFEFDANHPEGGCHHQKFVVIDGEISFLGGLDLCEDRWDDRTHQLHNPLRLSRGKPHQPFHDIQAYMRSTAVADSLHALFAFRWERAGGKPLANELMRDSAAAPNRFEIADMVPIAATTMALSRTDPQAMPEGPKPCLEILYLHEAAIANAQRLIYLETQYLSSHRITDAFEKRMRNVEQPKLEMVFILNMRGETLKEQAAVGLAQAQNIGRLRQVANETGHQLGMYYSLPHCNEGETPDRATYIHSKLMIVDDVFLTVGSANLTNRSMSLDTELNLTVEAETAHEPLANSIRKVRLNLLSEHTGNLQFELVEGLVEQLNQSAKKENARLQIHPSPTAIEQAALALIDPKILPFDPDLVEDLKEQQKSAFGDGGFVDMLRELFSNKST